MVCEEFPPNLWKLGLVQFYFFLSLFIYFEREQGPHMQAGEGQRERERRFSSRLHDVSVEPDLGLDLTNREIVT